MTDGGHVGSATNQAMGACGALLLTVIADPCGPRPGEWTRAGILECLVAGERITVPHPARGQPGGECLAVTCPILPAGGIESSGAYLRHVAAPIPRNCALSAKSPSLCHRERGAGAGGGGGRCGAHSSPVPLVQSQHQFMQTTPPPMRSIVTPPHRGHSLGLLPSPETMAAAAREWWQVLTPQWGQTRLSAGMW